MQRALLWDTLALLQDPQALLWHTLAPLAPDNAASEAEITDSKVNRFLTSFSHGSYNTEHDTAWAYDDAPLYLFDKHFDRTMPSLARDLHVPARVARVWFARTSYV